MKNIILYKTKKGGAMMRGISLKNYLLYFVLPILFIVLLSLRFS